MWARQPVWRHWNLAAKESATALLHHQNSWEMDVKVSQNAFIGIDTESTSWATVSMLSYPGSNSMFAETRSILFLAVLNLFFHPFWPNCIQYILLSQVGVCGVSFIFPHGVIDRGPKNQDSLIPLWPTFCNHSAYPRRLMGFGHIQHHFWLNVPLRSHIFFHKWHYFFCISFQVCDTHTYIYL